ncbi:MAG: hypothetical protein K8S99_05600 [Planctomycetes bacterium]|nr:hypothetical protein [Planctomycetota bacterium]
MRVIDAETQRPIVGASVQIGYIHFFGDIFIPPSEWAVTDARGTACVRVTTNPSSVGSVSVQVQAHGYSNFINNREGWMNEEVTRADATTPLAMTVALYSLPEPVVEIILVEGYRGLVRIEFDTREGRGRWAPGQRVFSFTALPTGTVLIPPVAPLTSTLIYQDIGIRARYANGTRIESLSNDANPSAIGFRWIAQRVFVVGTLSESEAVRARLGLSP